MSFHPASAAAAISTATAVHRRNFRFRRWVCLPRRRARVLSCWRALAGTTARCAGATHPARCLPFFLIRTFGLRCTPVSFMARLLFFDFSIVKSSLQSGRNFGRGHRNDKKSALDNRRRCFMMVEYSIEKCIIFLY